MAFSSGSDSKESACNAGDQGSIPGSGRSPGEGNGHPLQYSCLEVSMPPVNCISQPGRKAVPGDFFSGVVSLELGRTSGAQLTGEDKTTWTGLCSVGEL